MHPVTTTETFTVPVPPERLVRVLCDPEVLVSAVAGAEAGMDLDRVLAAGEVTILFGDVEDFTPLTERHGDQAAADAVEALDALVCGATVKSGGQQVKSTGDGFMAVFPDPAGALRAAVTIQGRLARRAGIPMRMRMGLHTGRVMRVRSSTGATDIVGRSVILASRVADAAAGGQILVTADVRRRTESLGGFRFLPDRRLRFKGLTGLHAVAELVCRAP